MKIEQNIVDKIIQMKKNGDSSRSIAKRLGVGKSTVNDIVKRSNAPKKQNLNMVFLDIETASSITATFGRFKQNISQGAVIREGGWLLSYAYKKAGEDKIYSSCVTPEEAVLADDERLCVELWDVLENTDICVWHNGDNFDLPMIKTRMIINGLPPIRKIKSIDTLNLAKEFRFNSNKLDSLCSQLSLDRKLEHSGMSLWVDCQSGDTEALNILKTYNEKDVEILEDLYNRVKMYSTRHPNLAVYYGDKPRCNICCSDNVSKTGNTVSTNLSVFEEYVCNDCQSRFKSRQSITTIEQRKTFLSN